MKHLVHPTMVEKFIPYILDPYEVILIGIDEPDRILNYYEAYGLMIRDDIALYVEDETLYILI